MAKHAEQRKPIETPRAAEAFADYVSLGPSRSLQKLVDFYRATPQSSTKPPPTRHLDTLKDWSVKHGWQDRIAQAITDRTLALLAEASELDAETFLATSREYRRRMDDTMRDAMPLDAIHPLRDRVKAPATRGAGVTLNVTIVQEAERLAAQLGISANDLLADASAIAAEAWERSE